MIKILHNLPIINPDLSSFKINEDSAFNNYKIDEQTYATVEDWLKNLGLIIGHFSVLVYPIGGSSPLHVDYRRATEFPKVNWIFGGGTMRLFKSEQKLEPTCIMRTDLQLPYEYYDSYDGMLEIDSFTGPGTLMVNAAIPHDVVNIDSLRYCFSLTPLKRRGRFLSWEDAKATFT